jgi:predicted kinase
MGRTPRLVVFSGLPETGKSTLARAVAQRLGAVWLRVDTVEASVVGAGIAPSFETGLAAYRVVRDLARENLEVGRDAVVDAVNGVEPARAMWRELTEELRTERFTVEVTCSDRDEHRRRVETRPPASPPLTPPTWDAVVRREYEPWAEPVLSIDALRPLEENVARILEYCSRPPA